mmetsp:Transcript_66373/g.178707  ORF Transcript_66373/g.178707 Transcript_66373/m.178707 type:complete len:303 (-) Transcript_66373:3-911(-)
MSKGPPGGLRSSLQTYSAARTPAPVRSARPASWRWMPVVALNITSGRSVATTSAPRAAAATNDGSAATPQPSSRTLNGLGADAGADAFGVDIAGPADCSAKYRARTIPDSQRSPPWAKFASCSTTNSTSPCGSARRTRRSASRAPGSKRASIEARSWRWPSTSRSKSRLATISSLSRRKSASEAPPTARGRSASSGPPEAASCTRMGRSAPQRVQNLGSPVTAPPQLKHENGEFWEPTASCSRRCSFCNFLAARNSAISNNEGTAGTQPHAQRGRCANCSACGSIACAGAAPDLPSTLWAVA